VKHVRHLGFALCVAFALLVGEHGALLHELGHGFQRIDHPTQDRYPGGDTCDKCFAFSQLTGAATGGIAVVAFALAAIVIALFVAITAPSRTVVATRSRAPPATL
jgi:hypothetical protein